MPTSAAPLTPRQNGTPMSGGGGNCFNNNISSISDVSDSSASSTLTNTNSSSTTTASIATSTSTAIPTVTIASPPQFYYRI